MPAAFVLVNAEIGSEDEVLEELKSTKGVIGAWIVYGVYDIVAKIEAGNMDDLKEIITEENQILAKESSFRCIDVHIDLADDLPHFKSDRGRLEQIFFNLFNYMISTMHEGGHFDIKAQLQDKDNIAVTLSDNGPGLPESDLKGIFEPFSNFATNTGSANLSLAITFALVQQIGGDIGIDSRLCIGTRFDIRIPAQLPESVVEMLRGGTTCKFTPH